MTNDRNKHDGKGRDLRSAVLAALKGVPGRRATNAMFDGGMSEYYEWAEGCEAALDGLADAITAAYPSLAHAGSTDDDGPHVTFFRTWDKDLDDQPYVDFWTSTGASDYGDDVTVINARMHRDADDDRTVPLDKRTLGDVIAALDDITR